MAQRPYEFREIESRWQAAWAGEDTFRPSDPPPALVKAQARRFYCLADAPGVVGEPDVSASRAILVADAVARFHRMRGAEVLFPVGWDTFGPAVEEAAAEAGLPPEAWVRRTIPVARAHAQAWGLAVDWGREVSTSDPATYRWTQWLFLKMSERGLVERRRTPTPWCPACKAPVADEGLGGAGVCGRCHGGLDLTTLSPWFLRMTAYADRLLADLSRLPEWPERLREEQARWIGRTEGVRVDFKVEGRDEVIAAFTQQPEALYGATFLAMAPEHPLVGVLTAGSPNEREVFDFVRRARLQPRADRTSVSGERDGVVLPVQAIHPLTGECIHIWVARHILPEPGTGAHPGIPAHDPLDLGFARRFHIPVRVAVQPRSKKHMNPHAMEEAFTGPGYLVDSGPHTGLPSARAAGILAQSLSGLGAGGAMVSYRLRDWAVSRPRLWGPPVPLVMCDSCGEVPVREEDLPVLLPDEILPAEPGDSPLARARSWRHTQCPACGKPAERATETLDPALGPAWLPLRFLSPMAAGRAFDCARAARWFPVDASFTHATGNEALELLRARFVTKVLADLGFLVTEEPFASVTQVAPFLRAHTQDGRPERMAAGRGNVVPAAEVIERLGTDTFRVHVLSAGPMDEEAEWQDDAVGATHRALRRLWETAVEAANATLPCQPASSAPVEGAPSVARDLWREASLAVRKATRDLEGEHRFHTAIPRILALVGRVHKEAAAHGTDPAVAPYLRAALRQAVMVLAPFAPHIAEDLWRATGGTVSVFRAPWPHGDEAACLTGEVEIAVQVDGRTRARIRVPAGTSEPEVTDIAGREARVARLLAAAEVDRVVWVQDEVVNFVLADRRTRTEEEKQRRSQRIARLLVEAEERLLSSPPASAAGENVPAAPVVAEAKPPVESAPPPAQEAAQIPETDLLAESTPLPEAEPLAEAEPVGDAPPSPSYDEPAPPPVKRRRFGRLRHARKHDQAPATVPPTVLTAALEAAPAPVTVSQPPDGGVTAREEAILAAPDVLAPMDPFGAGPAVKVEAIDPFADDVAPAAGVQPSVGGLGRISQRVAALFKRRTNDAQPRMPVEDAAPKDLIDEDRALIQGKVPLGTSLGAEPADVFDAEGLTAGPAPGDDAEPTAPAPRDGGMSEVTVQMDGDEKVRFPLETDLQQDDLIKRVVSDARVKDVIKGSTVKLVKVKDRTVNLILKK